MSSEKPVLGIEEADRDADFKPVTEQAPDRRRLIRRLVALAGLGITGALLSQDKAGLLPPVEAACTTSTICYTGSTPGNIIEGDNTGSGVGVYGSATVGTGVYGTSSSGNGVEGDSSSLTGVYGGSLDGDGVTGDSANGIGGRFSGAKAAIYADGNVGIGTATPGAALDFGTEVTTDKVYLYNSGGDVYGFGVQPGVLQIYGGAGQISAADIAFGNYYSLITFTEHMRIKGTGNVGIGTLSPQTALQVAQDFSTSGGYGQIEAIGSTNNNKRLTLGFDTSNNLGWIQASETSVAYRNLALNPNGGNVGIGTTTPARSLHLQGHNANFRMDRDIDTSAFILVRTASGNFNTIWKTFYVGVNASGVNNGSFFIGDNGTNVAGTSTTRLIIDNTGRVGLGRTPTANHLEVEGTASKTTAGSWLANSDMRIKTDIEDINDALATIRKLHPVRFRYTDSYKAKHPSIKNHPYYNFIAQEYREVFPDSVQDDGEGLLQMDSHNTTPYLVRAVQELSKQSQTAIKQLTEQNEALREEVRLLKTRLDAFEETGKLAAS